MGPQKAQFPENLAINQLWVLLWPFQVPFSASLLRDFRVPFLGPPRAPKSGPGNHGYNWVVLKRGPCWGLNWGQFLVPFPVFSLAPKSIQEQTCPHCWFMRVVFWKLLFFGPCFGALCVEHQLELVLWCIVGEVGRVNLKQSEKHLEHFLDHSEAKLRPECDGGSDMAP